MATSPTGFKVALLASDEDVRSGAAAVLTNCSYEVFPVASVEDCLRLFTFRRIDIILAESSDLDVEAQNNVQLTTVLKSVPLVLMTETDATNSLFQGLKLGAVDFLKRPLDESKVQSLWRHTLHKRLLSGGMTTDEGASSGQRRPGSEECPTTESKFPPLLSTHHSAPTGGSSIDQQPLLPTPIDLTRRSNVRPGDPSNLPEILEPPSTVLSPNLTSLVNPQRRSGQESQKRSLPSTSDQSQRRIRPNLMNQELPVQTPITASTSSAPPLLGIPPGCVPPVGSDGLAIGMPFLNQHPFVPAQPPINLNNFPIPSAFLFGPDQELQSGENLNDQRSVFEASAMTQFPVVPMDTSRPPTGMVPTSLASPLRSAPLQRVSSVPCTLTTETAQNTTNVSQGGSLDAPDSSPDLLLRKSPSLINF